jgi:hypothetical protein
MMLHCWYSWGCEAQNTCAQGLASCSHCTVVTWFDWQHSYHAIPGSSWTQFTLFLVL